MKNDLNLNLEPKCQGHSKIKIYQPGEQKTCHPENKRAGIPLVTDVQLIVKQVMTDLLNITKVGQQRSRMSNFGLWLFRSPKGKL